VVEAQNDVLLGLTASTALKGVDAIACALFTRASAHGQHWFKSVRSTAIL